jgi:hypothetical protein
LNADHEGDSSFIAARNAQIAFWMKQTNFTLLTALLAAEKSQTILLRQQKEGARLEKEELQRLNEELNQEISRLGIDLSIQSKRIHSLEEDLTRAKEEHANSVKSLNDQIVLLTTKADQTSDLQPSSKKRKLDDMGRSTEDKRNNTGRSLRQKNDRVSVNSFPKSPNLRQHHSMPIRVAANGLKFGITLLQLSSGPP